MESLLETYREIFKDKKRWKYYYRFKVNGFPLKNEESAWQFIYNYYKAGEKGRVFESLVQYDKLRSLHSVSVFFLGILLNELVLEKNYKENHLKPSFRYFWFLTSLYHDYAHFLEDDEKFIKNNNIEQLADLQRYLDIDSANDLFDNGFNCRFSKEEILTYFKYKLTERGEVDHGIIGGMLIYDRLIKNFEINYQEKKTIDPNVNRERFKHKNLDWSECQFKNFKRIASDIIAHNIWFCTKDDCIDNYKNKYPELKDLVINKSEVIDKGHKWQNNQFLFLLILTDTIEPLKFFKETSPERVMKGISISTQNDTIEIEVTDKCINPEKWFEKILDLNNWVHISVKKDGDRKLVVSKFK